ncbi:MAG: DUF2029 domain-containing protein, partial [Micromonosporaceae bacterium]|nr:DUF2029 domain-containing protein [Micromonosporaceae bacterium]
MTDRPGVGRLRWVGLAGTVLLAAGGFLAGARPGPAPATQAEALWGGTGGFRLGLLAYLAGLVLLGWAWWRLGPAASGRSASGARGQAAGGSGRLGRAVTGAGPGLRWVLVTGALWALPLLFAPPLGSRDGYAYACQGAVWLDGHDPYAVGAAAGGCPWLATVPSLWHETSAPYGPLALVVSAAAVALARAVTDSTDSQLLVAIGALRAVAVAGALLVAAFGPRLARACRVDPAAAAWLGLVTPLVAIHVVSGVHNDALLAGLVVAGLALAAGRPGRRPGTRAVRPVVAGVALGLAVAVKVTALAALPFAVLLAAVPGRPGGWRDGGWRDGGWRDGGWLVLGAVAGFAGLTGFTGLGTGWTGALADTGALAQWSSPPTGVGMAAGYLLRVLGVPGGYDAAVAVARLVGLGALLVVAAAVLVRAVRRAGDPRAVVGCAGVVLAATV